MSVCGWAFIALLLLSAGMVTVPGGADSVPAVRAFYQQHTAVIVASQVLGLVAAAVFLLFARGLRGWAPPDSRGRWVSTTGTLVSVAAAGTAVPVLWLSATSDDASSAQVQALARVSDLSDVLLFVTIAGFAATLASAVAGWVRALAGAVALLALARAVLLLTGSSRLEMAAPLAFLLLIAAVSTAPLLPRSPRRS